MSDEPEFVQALRDGMTLALLDFRPSCALERSHSRKPCGKQAVWIVLLQCDHGSVRAPVCHDDLSAALNGRPVRCVTCQKELRVEGAVRL